MPDSKIFLDVMLAVLSLTVLGVGIYLVLVLKEVRQLLKKFNSTMLVADGQIQKVTAALQQLGNFTAAFQTGIKAVEAIRQHLADRKKETKDSDE